MNEQPEQTDEQWIRGKAAQIPINIDDVIARLAGQQTLFSDHINRRWDDLDFGQLARLLAAVVAQGAATHHDLDTWLPYLLPIERLYVATDTDAAGEQTATY